ncbi:MAG: polysaccharide biosynthesis C-terminal domain-containing protein [Lachnospiraceae bacterium]|nr:polysaccharide biosynthesis C-terminal domain-containing protein [Lachnospiraceae bacterium]
MNKLFSKVNKETNAQGTKEKMYYEDLPIDFKRKGNLMQRKILEYLPAMLITNISNLLLISVDGLVVGNMIGKEAYASVNIFEPVISLIGAFSILLSAGISTSLSTAIGTNSQKEINRVRGASFHYMIIMIAFFTVIQIPFVYFIIDSYSLNTLIHELMWQYAIGIMIATPLGMVSTIGVFQLQIIGKMKVIMSLSLMEGGVNLVLNILFIGVFNMGISGAGYGTACANLLRASATVIYLARHTDIYRTSGYKPRFRDFLEITRIGAPDFAYSIMMAFQTYCMTKILLNEFGTDGGVIKGVAFFSLSVTSVFINGLKGAMRPLVGLLSGADDRVGLSKLVEFGSIFSVIGDGVFVAVVMFFPEFFFRVNGITDIPDGGITALRFFSLFFIARGLNSIIGLVLANRKDSSFVTRLNFVGYALLPALAFVISIIAPGQWLWLSYLITETFILIVLILRYSWWKHKDISEDYNNDQDMVLYMTVKPNQAITASRAIRKFADDYEINPKISYRVALCMEEMVAYANSIRDMDEDNKRTRQKRAGRHFSTSQEEYSVQLMVRFKGKNAATFTMLDDGQSIQLDVDEKERELTTGNYEVIRRLSKSFDYQYILDMNYSTIRFEV